MKLTFKVEKVRVVLVSFMVTLHFHLVRSQKQPMDFVYNTISNLTNCSKLYKQHALSYSASNNCLLGQHNSTLQYICEDYGFQMNHLYNKDYHKDRANTLFLKVTCKKFPQGCACGQTPNATTSLQTMASSSKTERCTVKILFMEYFEGLNDLEFLDLSWNDITYISPDLFNHMKKLIYFDISHNPLHQPTQFLFSYLPNFQNLIVLKMNSDFNYNVQNQSTRTNCSVYFLEMTKNNFSYEALSTILNTFATIDVLFLNSNQIFIKEKESLPMIPNLLVLNFADNYLSILPNSFFINNSNLVALDLSRNGITNFEKYALSGLHKLRVLGLSYNNISLIDKHALQPLMSLEYLLLDHNAIFELNIQMFTYTKELHSLILHNNHIKSIMGKFQMLPNLQSLDLSKNNIKHIKAETFAGSEHLQYLYLNDNSISSIEEGSFKDLNLLNEINLCKNTLTEKSDLNALLCGLQNLTIIRVNDNLISDTPQTGFTCSKTVFFQLTRNRLTHIRSGTFTAMASLEMLYLGDNYITTIEPHAFPEKLRVLNLTGNLLTILGAEFNNMHSLEYLVMEHNSIFTFSHSSLQYLPSLITLNLCHNNLTTIPTKTFQFLRNLENLILCNNKLDFNFRQNNPFYGLARLKGLDLTFNRITSIDGLLTSSYDMKVTMANRKCKKPLFTHLVELYLAANNLYRIDYRLWNRDEFDRECLDNPNIQLILDTIDLRGNKIDYIDTYAFYDLSMLPIKIHLQYNRIETLQPLLISENIELILDKNPIMCDCHMRWLKENTTIKTGDQLSMAVMANNYHLTYCQVMWKPKVIKHFIDVNPSEFYCSARQCAPKCTCFSSSESGPTEVAYCIAQNLTEIPDLPPSTTHLDISHNTFTNLTTKNLHQAYRVQTLNMSNSGIVFIEQNAFSVFPHMVVLDLQRNKLKYLQDGLFIANPSLKVLVLNGNDLTFLGEYFFKGLKNLREVYLHENRLAYFSHYTVGILSQIPLLNFTFYGNNPACDCPNEVFLQWLQTQPVISDVSDITVQCENATKPLTKVDLSAVLSHCEDNGRDRFLLITLVPCVSTVVLIIVISLTVWYHRRKIRPLLYPLIRRFMSKSFQSTLYDAYVSYADEDFGWIQSELLPKIENGTYSFKLCLRDRDFMPGGNIAETVYHGITKSRKIMFILTQSFLQNEWCLYELECAHRVCLLDQKRRLIVVFKDITFTSQLPKDIKFFISNARKLYLSKSLFWEELAFRLSQTHSVVASSASESGTTGDPLQTALLPHSCTTSTTTPSTTTTPTSPSDATFETRSSCLSIAEISTTI